MFGKRETRPRGVGIRFTDEEYDILYERAREEGYSVSEFIRKAIGVYLDSKDPKRAKKSGQLPSAEAG